MGLRWPFLEYDVWKRGRLLDTERRRRILNHVERSGGVRVGALAEKFGVSPATVRRDLAHLDGRGLIERAHGGAAPRRPDRAPTAPEPPMLDRSLVRVEEKRAIGKAAAEYVGNGDVVYISGGTTTAEMVPHLSGRRGLTVITSALNIACLLAALPDISTVVVGGTLRHSEMSMLGPLTEDALRNLRADKLFMGSPAVHHEHGLSADDLTEVQSDRNIAAIAGEVFVLADHTKFGRIATMRQARITDIRCLITDSAAPRTHLDGIAEKGVEVRAADAFGSTLADTRGGPR